VRNHHRSLSSDCDERISSLSTWDSCLICTVHASSSYLEGKQRARFSSKLPIPSSPRAPQPARVFALIVTKFRTIWLIGSPTISARARVIVPHCH